MPNPREVGQRHNPQGILEEWPLSVAQPVVNDRDSAEVQASLGDSPWFQAPVNRTVAAAVGRPQPQAPASTQDLPSVRGKAQDVTSTARTVDTSGSGATFHTHEEVAMAAGTTAPSSRMRRAKSGDASTSLGRFSPCRSARTLMPHRFFEQQSPVESELRKIHAKLERERGPRPTKVTDFVHSSRGQTMFGIIVILNALFIGIDITVTDINGSEPWIMVWIESLFLVIFWIEILLRIRAQGCLFFFSVSGAFDFAVTLLGSVDTWILTPIDGDAGAFSGAAALRVIRLLRLLRLLQTLRTFDELTALVHVMRAGAQAIFFLSVLFLCVIYVSSCVVIVGLWADRDDPDIIKLIGFGTTGCMWSHLLFATGDGWADEWVRPVRRYSALWTFYCLGLVILLNMLLLNMMVGTIVKKALDLRLQEVSSHLDQEANAFKEDVLALLEGVHLEEAGRINREECQLLLRSQELQKILESFSVSVDVPENRLLCMMGLAGSNTVTFADFLEAISRFCFSRGDIRTLMVESDVASLKHTLNRRTCHLQKVLDGEKFGSEEVGSRSDGVDQEVEMSCVSSRATVEQGEAEEERSPLPRTTTPPTCEAPDCRWPTEKSIQKVRNDSGDDRSTVGAESTTYPGDANSRSAAETQLGDAGDDAQPRSGPFMCVLQRLGELEEQQENMFRELTDVRRQWFGRSRGVAVRCKAGHPLMPLGTAGKPTAFAAYEEWVCNATESRHGCLAGGSTPWQFASMARYHCSLCHYDLCGSCYVSRLRRRAETSKTFGSEV